MFTPECEDRSKHNARGRTHSGFLTVDTMITVFAPASNLKDLTARYTDPPTPRRIAFFA